MPRILLAFLVAPLAPCFLTAIVIALMSGDLMLIIPGTGIYALFSYFFALILGVPAYFLAARAKWLSLPQVTAAGGFLGFVSGAIIIAARSGSVPETLVAFSLWGAITAFVFWWVGLNPGSNIAVKRDAPEAARPLP